MTWQTQPSRLPVPIHSPGVMNLLIGYLIAAGLMIVAALVGPIIGVRAERRSLESVTAPLTAIQKQTGASG